MPGRERLPGFPRADATHCPRSRTERESRPGQGVRYSVLDLNATIAREHRIKPGPARVGARGAKSGCSDPALNDHGLASTHEVMFCPTTPWASHSARHLDAQEGGGNRRTIRMVF